MGELRAVPKITPVKNPLKALQSQAAALETLTQIQDRMLKASERIIGLHENDTRQRRPAPTSGSDGRCMGPWEGLSWGPSLERYL